MQRWAVLVFLGVLLGLAGEGVSAEKLPSNYWPSPPELTAPSTQPTAVTRKLVRDLTSEDFQTRQRAAEALRSMGAGSFPGLRQVVEAEGDPELELRTQPFFKADELVIPVSFTRAMRRAMADYQRDREGHLADEKRDLFTFTGWLNDTERLLFLNWLQSQEKNPLLLTAIAKSQKSATVARARVAIVLGDFDGAEAMLKTGLESEADAVAAYTAFRALRLGKAFDPEAARKELDDLQLSDLRKDGIAMYFHRAKGDIQGAARLAKRFPATSSSPAVNVLLEARDWDGLAELFPQIAKNGTSGKFYFPQIAALRLAGRPADAEAAYMAAPERQWTTGRPQEDWILTLLMNGMVDESLVYLKDPADGPKAYAILVHAMRMREAKQVEKSYSPAAAHLLVERGFVGEARKQLLANKPNYLKLQGMGAQEGLRYAYELRFAGLEEEAVRAEKEAWEWKSQTKTNYGSPQELFADYDQYSEVRFWVGTSPFSSTQERYDAAMLIYQGKAKPDFSGVHSIEKMLLDCSSIYDLATACRALVRRGYSQEAVQLVEEWCKRENNPSGYACLGDWALEMGQNKLAVEYYLKAVPLNYTDASLMYRLGLALKRQEETRAMGEKLMERTQFLVLGGRTSDMARAMRRFQSVEEGDEWMDFQNSRFGNPYLQGNLHERVARARAKAEARGDYRTALEMQSIALFRPSWIVKDRNLNTLAHVRLYYRLRALEALERKDFATVADSLERGLKVGPPDVELLEKTVPALAVKERGAAEKIVKGAVERLDPVVEDYPEVATYREQLKRVKAIKVR